MQAGSIDQTYPMPILDLSHLKKPATAEAICDFINQTLGFTNSRTRLNCNKRTQTNEDVRPEDYGDQTKWKTPTTTVWVTFRNRENMTVEFNYDKDAGMPEQLDVSTNIPSVLFEKVTATLSRKT